MTIRFQKPGIEAATIRGKDKFAKSDRGFMNIHLHSGRGPANQAAVVRMAEAR